MRSKGNIVYSIIKWFCFIFTIAALFVMYTPAANMMARPLIVEEGGLKRADLIAVLGGGAYKNGVLGGASTERLIRALLLYRQGYAARMIFSGGSIGSQPKKILHTVLKSKTPPSFAAVEAALMKEVSSGLGIPEKDAAVDAASADTYENLKNIMAYMEREGFKSCILVTSSTHMRRSEAVARKLGLECIAAPVPDTTMYRRGAVERASLMREVLWEYAGLALYRIYGYI